MFFSLLPLVAAICSLVVAVVSIVRKRRSLATWCFFAGMLALGVDSLLIGLSLRATNSDDAVSWLTLAFIVKSIVPAIWLAFSVTYSRGDYRKSLRRWSIPLLTISAAPVALSIGFRDEMFQVASAASLDEFHLEAGPVAKALNVILLLTLMLVLMNVEQTFRSAVGTSRWRIKFVVLAVAVIFGARLYVRTQWMLFAAPDLRLWSVESGGLLIGCVFLAIAYARTGLAEIDVYPSRAVLRSSVTVLLVGGYLFVLGVLAQMVRRFGGAEQFQVQAFVVLIGTAGLAVLLLSDRARRRIHVFVDRHFKKAQHDSVRIWTRISQLLASVKDASELCKASAKLISETFDVLSVAVWLVNDEKNGVALIASTASHIAPFADGTQPKPLSAAVIAGLQQQSSAFDLESLNSAWARELREHNPISFPNGGRRWCVPLRSGEQIVGALVLGDRVSGVLYSVEERELLKCIGDQITSVLLNLRLATEVARARELEAFRTMSAFFVHDLKNVAASLNPMLKNLPVHFDDPSFRADAVRGIGNTAHRIDEMISRLGAFREPPAARRVKTDLNQLVNEALRQIDFPSEIVLAKELQPLPHVLVDREQIQNVIANLVLNAREALDGGGMIRVCTEHRDGNVLISVADSGPGMTAEFVKERLFRPFQSTKQKGLGIGLFQCRAVVQAHGGGIQVESEPGKGAIFTVSLPASNVEWPNP